jgi:hypothetical protein
MRRLGVSGVKRGESLPAAAGASILRTARSARMGQVRYEALMRTYYAVKSQVQ